MAANGSEQVHTEQIPEVMPRETALTVPERTHVPLLERELSREDVSAIMEGRKQILLSAREAALRLTYPEDWMLYKDKDGREVCYLQDCGNDRVRDIFGISVHDVSKPEKVENKDGSYSYYISGSGTCRLTGQVVENMEGGRSSTEDFVQDKGEMKLTEAQREMNVRKAARANLDGNISRELSGLKSVPLQELADAWNGTTRDYRRCRKGRGYAKEEGVGGSVNSTPSSGSDMTKDLPPICDTCTAKRKDGVAVEYKLVPGGISFKTRRPYAAFWACPNSKTCLAKSINAAEWHNDPRSKPPAPDHAEPLAQEEPGAEG